MIEIPLPGRMPELDAALGAAEAAADAVMRVYGGGFAGSAKADGSPVTDADLQSNKIITGLLSGTGRPVLSEEGPDDPRRLGSDEVWIVDPLDGTSDFVDGTGEFTVMIALARGGVPVLGVIARPAAGEFYAAQAGMGAYRLAGGRWDRIRASTVANLAGCRAVGSRHHLSGRDRGLVDGLGMACFGSVGSSLKAAMIASGGAEVYLTTTDRMKEWDTAASHCIVSEAGGRMTDLAGGSLTYNRADVFHRGGLLVTNGAVHAAALERLEELARA